MKACIPYRAPGYVERSVIDKYIRCTGTHSESIQEQCMIHLMGHRYVVDMGNVVVWQATRSAHILIYYYAERWRASVTRRETKFITKRTRSEQGSQICSGARLY
jgi:hypothetical protein